jgi:hypothetical protein
MDTIKKNTETLIDASREIGLEINIHTTYSMVLVRERTTPTERPPLVGEVTANFCG